MNTIRLKGMLLAAGSLLLSLNSFAQDDTTGVLRVSVPVAERQLEATVGARAMFDAAYYYNPGYTALKPGFRIADARIRASLSYNGWLLYADFDFSKGHFSQKNLFLQYTLPARIANHTFKVGYYANPASMSANASAGSYHFLSRPAPVLALGPKRELGASYCAYNDYFFANQGVFATNFYDSKMEGFQNLALGGRWLFRLNLAGDSWLHAGAMFRYENFLGGEVANGQLKPSLALAGSLESYVDKGSQFVSATLPWVKHTFDVGADFLYVRPNLFVRGEYLYKYVAKARDGKKLLESQLGGKYSWTTVESIEKGLPLRANAFHGGYLELGYKIFGSDYTYSKSAALLGGLRGAALEVVARYSYLGLNDLVPGETFLVGRGQYYPKTGIADYPAESTSVSGGNLHNATLGVNYSVNSYVQFMASYTCSMLKNDFFPQDKLIHGFQLRAQFQI